MNIIRISVVLLALTVAAAQAHAQTPTLVSLAVPNPARWDAAAFAGARSVNDAERSRDWNQWAHVGAFSASLGRQWTTHLKTDADIAVTPDARRFVQSTVDTSDGQTVRFGQRNFSTASVAGSLVYQFGENAWFHPFLGGGVDMTRDRSRLALQQQPLCLRPPCVVTPLPEQQEVSYKTRPFLTGGFKWYVSERAFVRGDVRTVWSASRADSVGWRIGIGVDF